MKLLPWCLLLNLYLFSMNETLTLVSVVKLIFVLYEWNSYPVSVVILKIVPYEWTFYPGVCC